MIVKSRLFIPISPDNLLAVIRNVPNTVATIPHEGFGKFIAITHSNNSFAIVRPDPKSLENQRIHRQLAIRTYQAISKTSRFTNTSALMDCVFTDHTKTRPRLSMQALS